MKNLLLALFLLSAVSFGKKVSFLVTGSGGSPIPAAYSASDTQSQVLTGMRYMKTCCVYNETATRMAFRVDGGATAPSTGSGEVPVPPSVGVCIHGEIGAYLYLRGYSSTTALSVHGFCE